MWSEGLGEDDAGQVGVGLHPLVHHRDVADLEPAEREVHADPAVLGQVVRIGEAGHGAPGRRQGRVLQVAHQPRQQHHPGLGRRGGQRLARSSGRSQRTTASPAPTSLRAEASAAPAGPAPSGRRSPGQPPARGQVLERPGRLGPDVTGPEELHQAPRRRVLRLEPPGHELRLQQHPLGVVDRVEVLLRHHRQVDVRQQARHRLALAEVMHRSPGLSSDPGDHGHHRRGRLVLPQLPLPGLRRPGQLPDVQLPLAQDPVHHAPRRLQGAALAAIAGVLVGEELLQDLEHAAARGRVGVGCDDGGEVQGVAPHAGGRAARQTAQVGDQRGHGGVVELVARHQEAERPTLLVLALPDGPGQRGVSVGISMRDVAEHVGQVGVLDVPGAGPEQVAADDGRDDALPLVAAQAAAPVAGDAGRGQPLESDAALAEATQGLAGGEHPLAVDPLTVRGRRALRQRPGGRQQQQQDQEGEAGRRHKDQWRATSWWSSRASSSEEAKPSMRTQRWPGAARRKVSGVWSILSPR